MCCSACSSETLDFVAVYNAVLLRCLKSSMEQRTFDSIIMKLTSIDSHTIEYKHELTRP